ncbi:MAG TPA: acyl-CoA dehydrogenase [Idiomarina baltica]|uniref:3-sulfinopropanoyl-CoA desulfinase n=1 Tax=Idiomarina baltica TaxID=190892 RepID=A0A348WL63_9GAMM|nr:acyl-CoA dehydrogenase family protein [Alteromonas macleodii]MAD10400.1 acyl-CoA dehydrogenase [Alteromonas sp.]HAI70829.1 acyl-CoA dehydrogenase [Alteromonas australica]HAR55275.1 acyl-CoA dehydrogenase [Idiomarina baltica]|tara:strand:- start:7473 stop:8630 length:1158 start_codon:yes stop_codon:yes gene_type:complete
MNFTLTEEQQLIQDTAKRFAENELAPVAQTLDETKDKSILLANCHKLAELGFMGLNIDGEYGGTEAGTIAFSVAMTEIARGCASTAVTMSVTNMVAEVIQAVGSEQQKAHYLPLICSGEYKAGSFCLTESGAGSDPASMSTQAEKTDKGYVINGTKQWITSAEFAGVFVVWAVTDANAAKGKGITCFLVDANSAGITVGPAEKKMGQHGSATNEVHFNNVEVPDSAVLGKVNDGFRIAVAELAGGRIGIGSLALGVGLAAMDYATAYIQERKQFGRPIADFQGLQWMMADRYTELEAARLLLLSASDKKDNGLAFAKEASMAKVFASEKANAACYTALQMLGGYGYMQEYPLERMARDVRITSIYEGTSEIQRVIIAREILREFK